MSFLKKGSFLREFFLRFFIHEVPDLSAQLSYYFLLSLFPFLISTIALLPYFPFTTEDVLSLLSQYIPVHSMHIIEYNVRSVLDVRRGGLLSISILIALWSASYGTLAIMKALNTAYEVEESRSLIRARLVALFLTFSMMLAIIIALLLPVFGRYIGMFLFNFIGLSETFASIWNILRWGISSGVIFIVFSYLYYFAPNCNIKLKDVWIGATFATLGWQAISYVFSIYVGRFVNLSATYGSLAGIIALLLWFFLSGMILILGGEINAIRSNLRPKIK